MLLLCYLNENFTLIIFFFISPTTVFYNPIYKNEIFFLLKLTFQHHLAQDMYGLLYTKMKIF